MRNVISIISINIEQLIKLALMLNLLLLAILPFLVSDYFLITIILLCLGGLVFSLLLLHPRIAFYIFLISLFIAPIILNFVPSVVGLTIREVPLILIYLSIFFSLCLKGSTKLRNVKFRALETLLLILFFLMLFQALRQNPINIGLLGFRSIMYYSPVFFLIPGLFNTKEKIQQLISILFYIGIVLAVLSILQHIFTEMLMNIFGFERGDIAFRTRGGFLKASASLGDASSFAAIITINLIIALCLLISHTFGQLKGKFNLITFILLFTIGLILTLSRINYLSFILIFILMGFFYKKRMFRYYVILLMMFFLINLILGNLLVENIASAFAIGGSELGIKSTLNRIEIIKKGIEWLLEQPIIGHGLGVTGYPSLHYAELLPHGYFATDNYYLKLLIESGMIGMSLFLILLFMVINRGIRFYNIIQDDYLKNLCLGLTFGIVLMSINNFANSVLELPAINSFFWLIIGLITATKMADQKLLEKRKPNEEHFENRKHIVCNAVGKTGWGRNQHNQSD